MDPIIFILKILTFLFGGFLVIVTLMTYLNKKDVFLRNLSIGFFIILIGSLIEEVLFMVSSWDTSVIHLIEAIILLLGFSIVAYSLYLE